MRAGTLRKRGTIEQPSLSTGVGEKTATWPTFAGPRYMAIEPLAGSELFRAQQAASDVTTRIRLRFVSGVKPTMRVRLENGRIFDILSARNLDERGAELELLCREKVS